MALAQDETTIDFIVVGIVAIVIGYIVYELVDSGSSSSSGGGLWAWLGGAAAGAWAYVLFLA